MKISTVRRLRKITLFLYIVFNVVSATLALIEKKKLKELNTLIKKDVYLW